MRSQIKVREREQVRERDADVLVETLFATTSIAWPKAKSELEEDLDGDGRLCVIVPAYNEEESLAGVVKHIEEVVPEAHVVVVNDASLDSTEAVARSLGVPVLTLPLNLGIGGAVQTGLKYAVRYGFSYAMQVDGDGQHDPMFIPDLLEILEDDKADMVIGSRFITKEGYQSSPMRLIGIKVFSWLIGIATDRWIHDPTSGFRGYNRVAMEFAAMTYPSDFPEPESVVTMLRNTFRVREVPVRMRKRLGGVSSIRRDLSFKAWYFVVSNSIAIIVSGLKRQQRQV